MRDKFVPNLDPAQRGEGAPSLLGAKDRYGMAKALHEYHERGVMRDSDLAFVVANGIPDSTTTTARWAVSRAPTPRQPSVFWDAFTGDAYKLVTDPEADWDDGVCAAEIGGDDLVTDWQSALLFDPKDTGVTLSLGTPYKMLSVKNGGTDNVEAGSHLEGGYDPEGCRRVPINELAWQCFSLAAGPYVQNLQVIFLLDIRNNGFQVILEEAHRTTQRPMNKPTVWGRQDTPHFERLLGSDNVSGKMLQLTNHHDAVGNKRVAKIITVTRFVKDPEGKRENESLTAALVLEPIPDA